MVAGTVRKRLPERRIRASTVPKMMPPMVAMMVSSMLKIKPLITNWEIISQFRKLMSSPSMSVSPACGAGDDEAGDLHPLLDKSHDPVDRKGRDGIQRRHRQVDFNAARGLFLRLHGEHGEFGDGDRKSDRRILQEVHRLAGERRNDDAKGHRQN